MKTVKRASESKTFESKSIPVRLAGGMGMRAAKQDSEALLRRAVMACLLWEDLAYETGESVAGNIRELVAEVPAQVAYDIAVEARFVQKLRHVPLYIAAVMAGLETHKHLVSDLLNEIVARPDELAEVIAIYWKLNGGRTPISAQVKKGLAKAFGKFSEYSFAKYRGTRNEIKLKDVLRIVHPKPMDMKQSKLFGAIRNDTLATPDTWETVLSSGADKKEAWTRLIEEGKLGALAFLRNLRNMNEAGVKESVVSAGMKKLNPKWLLPLHFLSAVKYAPNYALDIEDLMLRMFNGLPKLPGTTVFVVDVSGSMGNNISSGSEMTRKEVAFAMAMIAGHMTERFILYVTAGSDLRRIHKTERVNPERGFGLIMALERKGGLGGGGIFTRQCLEYIKEDMQGDIPERIIVFSDSEDCDKVNKTPKPFGLNNYIVDVSSHAHGINYDGVWDAEISGWSEGFISFILAMEGVTVEQEQEN